MNSAWLALGFLSRIPAPAVEFTPVTLSRALFWFPWVGALLGGSWWVSAVWLTPWCGSTMTAYALLLQGVLFTGALHLDGLADTFDGFSAAGGGKERALSAMKDSRIGAHGAVALGLVLLGKFVAFQSLTVAAAGTVCLTAAILPRFLSALTVAIARPARSDGLAVAFASEASGSAGKDDTSKPGLVFAGAGAIWLLIPVGVAGGESERWMILLGTSLVAMASTWLLLRRFSRVFGGVTGDTHGALIEVGETVILLTGAALGGR